MRLKQNHELSRQLSRYKKTSTVVWAEVLRPAVTGF
jgi:hypothetical protein